MNRIEIGRNNAASLNGWLSEDARQAVLVVADTNTVVHARPLMDGLTVGKRLFVFGGQVAETDGASALPTPCLVPDEAAVGRLLVETREPCDAILCVGSGTLCDLARYVSFRLGIPFYVYATAASMDGYTSSAAPLTVDGLKRTFPAHAPLAVFGDAGVIANAPAAMTAAGYGDMMGKYTSVLDWELEGIIRDNGDFSPGLASQMREITEKCRHCGEGDATAILNALLASGEVMNAAGHTKPASGSEHHLSHFWEMALLTRGAKPVPHGLKVGAAVPAVLRVYAWLAQEEIDWEQAYHQAGAFDIMAWKTEMRRVYGKAADGVLRMWRGESPQTRTALLAKTQRLWPALLEILHKAIHPDIIKAELERMGCPVNPAAFGITRREFSRAALHAHRIRKRFTVAGLADILGVLPAYAHKLERTLYD
jgi:glycerol-1-phosphate dehydrogenase [NAD(P)+]